MGVAATLLLAANIVYATSYVVTRLVLDDVPPMTLALLRLVLGAAVLVVLTGVPGVTLEILPRWRGDILLILSGIAYASYSLLGRTVLTDTNATAITARSIVWGMLVTGPLAALEWAAGARPVVTPSAVAGALYVALVISAGADLVGNCA